MAWLDGEKKSLECSIKYTKKAMISQICMVVVNVAGIGWNTWWLIYANGSASAGFGFGLGAFTSNLLWTLCFCCKYWGEIMGDKQHLRFIKEIEMKGKLDEDREEYRKARAFYEKAYQNIMEEYLKAKPEGAKKLNTEIFNPTVFPNCT